MPKCYLVSLNVENRICLVVGGGKVAERKVHSLLDRGALVRLVSPEITAGIISLVQEGKVEHIRENYQESHLDGAFLVIGATDEEEVNARVSAHCMNRGILVNVVDDPPRGNFYVPAVVQRGSLQIAVSTDGKSPMLARKIRERLEGIFPAEYDEVVELIGELREKVIKETCDPAEKERILTALLEQTIMELLWEGKFELAKERIRNACICGGSESQDSTR
ncbi:MAG: siroheme synthase [Peptococcaceae bacterium BRH_c4a]|nr:MAG: siroheme synthase [Peptococcaceae bacterium BRH_c4a]